jgi:PHD/YefM family antitoxin component YafN of YafNO toxin-antitoxin module
MENTIVGSKLAVLRSLPRLQHLPVTQARAKLGALVSRIRRNKEYLILEQDGVPVAGVMDIDEFEDYLELRDPRVRTHIRQSSAEYLAGKSRPAEEFVAELRGQPRQKVRQRSKA